MADQTPSLDAIKRRAEQVNRRHRTPNEVASDFSRNERDRATTRASTLLEKAETQARNLNPSELREVQDSLSAAETWHARHKSP